MTSAFSSAGDRSSRLPGGDMPLQNLKSLYVESPDLSIFTRAVAPCPPTAADSKTSAARTFAPITLHSTNPLERLNKEVKRRADVVGIFPNEASITRLIGAVLLEQNDEWLVQHRYMQIEGMAEPIPPLIDADPAKLPPLAA